MLEDAVEAITRYVTHSLQCYYSTDASDEHAFLRGLEDAALHCHSELQQRTDDDPDRAGMATTLTLWLGVWPRAYVLQVGDSRAYLFRDDQLTQLSRDQTMAQVLVDQGILTRVPYQTEGERQRHEYRLTTKGIDLYPTLVALMAWGD